MTSTSWTRRQALGAAGASGAAQAGTPLTLTMHVFDAAADCAPVPGAALLLRPELDGSGGYVADFSVGIAGGGSATGTTPAVAEDTTVAAVVTSVKAVRLASGARQVRVRLRSEERVVARIRVTRAGHTLAVRRVSLTAGAHTIRLQLGARLAAGGARVSVHLTDTASNARTSVRTVHVPKRRRP